MGYKANSLAVDQGSKIHFISTSSHVTNNPHDIIDTMDHIFEATND